MRNKIPSISKRRTQTCINYKGEIGVDTMEKAARHCQHEHHQDRSELVSQGNWQDMVGTRHQPQGGRTST